MKQLCFTCLPLFVALLLLGWLSFGLPHPTWILLLKTIFQAGTLIDAEGMAFLLPLAILAIQSIFLLCAWGLLGWAITREVKELLALYSELSMPAPLPAAAAAPAPQQAPAIPAPQQAPAAPAPPDPAFAPTVLNSYNNGNNPSYLATARPGVYAPPPPPPPPIPENPFVVANPFDAEEDFPTQLSDISTQFPLPSDMDDAPTQFTTPPDYEYLHDSHADYAWEDSAEETIRPSARKSKNERRHVEEVEGSLYEEEEVDEMDQPRRPRSTSIQRRLPSGQSYPPRTTRRISDASLNRSRALPQPESRGYTPVPPIEEEENPLEATEIAERTKLKKARNTGEFEHEQVEELPPPPAPPAPSQKKREKSTAIQRRPAPQKDPFAVVEDDPFAVKEDVLNIFEEQPAQQEQNASPEEEDDAVFVFGNPFEGPLPDVFMEDEDLKRSILEQQASLSDDPAARKEGKKPTGIRKRTSS